MLASDLKKALEETREVKITVKGRKSGKKVTLPIWFVKDGDTLLLLPVGGSETNWYRNVTQTPTMDISAGRASVTLEARPSSNTDRVREVVEKFRAKYGTADVRKYYSKFDACVEVTLP